MTKSEQRAAAGRILAKEPLTAEELERYRYLSRGPEEYRRPGDVRVCGVCEEEFRDEVGRDGSVTVAMLDKFSDHQTEHNPSPGQWASAHRLIQQAADRAKARA